MLKIVYAICPSWLGNEREDIVQSSLAKLMRSAGAGRTSTTIPNAYLRRVAHSQLIDEIRQRSRSRESPLDGIEEGSRLLVATDPDPHARCEHDYLGRAIRRCLKTMVKPRQQALSLWLQGYDYREIAEQNGWDPKRAENLVTRGRVHLRKSLTIEGYRN